MKIAVHNGKFHADDVFACAIARLIYPSCDIIRTRDEIELSAVDMRIDVGGKNNPASNDFDHHMKGGAGERTNGVPYAACGLMWKHFGKQITPNDFVWNYVDQKKIEFNKNREPTFLSDVNKPGEIPFSDWNYCL